MAGPSCPGDRWWCGSRARIPLRPCRGTSWPARRAPGRAGSRGSGAERRRSPLPLRRVGMPAFSCGARRVFYRVPDTLTPRWPLPHRRRPTPFSGRAGVGRRGCDGYPGSSGTETLKSRGEPVSLPTGSTGLRETKYPASGEAVAPSRSVSGVIWRPAWTIERSTKTR